MWEVNDPILKELVEQGIPLERLEARLRPVFGLGDRQAEIKAHDGFDDYSEEGFLGLQESLLEVVHSDWLVVEQHGTRHQEIAAALEKAIKKGKMPNPVFEIECFLGSRGYQGCPWECQGLYQPADNILFIFHQDCLREDLFALVDLFCPRLTRSDERRRAYEKRRELSERFAVVTPIHPHLIGDHHFFEGPESPYRAEPRVLIEALGLARRGRQS